MSLDRLKINQKSYYNLPNSAFWGWLSVESHPQNPVFRNNPVNFHPWECEIENHFSSSQQKHLFWVFIKTVSMRGSFWAPTCVKNNGYENICNLKAQNCLFILTYGQTYLGASDIFQDWLAQVTHGAKKGGSFSKMMGPSISNLTQLTFG